MGKSSNFIAGAAGGFSGEADDTKELGSWVRSRESQCADFPRRWRHVHLGDSGKTYRKMWKTCGKIQLVGVSTTMLVGDNGENQADFHGVIVG